MRTPHHFTTGTPGQRPTAASSTGGPPGRRVVRAAAAVAAVAALGLSATACGSDDDPLDEPTEDVGDPAETPAPNVGDTEVGDG